MIVEHGLHKRLAIIKRPADGNGVHVGIHRRRHHAPLDIGYPSLWKQDDDVDALRPAKRFDGCPACIA